MEKSAEQRKDRVTHRKQLLQLRIAHKAYLKKQKAQNTIRKTRVHISVIKVPLATIRKQY